jgi:hypothetical protein
MENILSKIENSGSHIENLKTKVIKAKKIQLHSGIEGFESPDAYGIYRNTGGAALGVVGSQFMPCDLELFLDAIQHSVLNSGLDVDLTKLKYVEFLGGQKVSFRLPYKKYEIKTPMKGDTLETDLEFRTGFDGKTKMSIGFLSLRCFCNNGAKNWQKDVDLSLKNTTKNQAKLMYFTNEIITAATQVDNYVELLNMVVKKSVKQSDIDKFLTTLTGYSVKDYTELTTRKRNILDSINKQMAIEIQNTGANWFSVLQGVTRYTTHDLAKKNVESILFASASQMNERAHQLVFAQLN